MGPSSSSGRGGRLSYAAESVRRKWHQWFVPPQPGSERKQRLLCTPIGMRPPNMLNVDCQLLAQISDFKGVEWYRHEISDLVKHHTSLWWKCFFNTSDMSSYFFPRASNNRFDVL